jgi:RHS repeat-associated protein
LNHFKFTDLEHDSESNLEHTWFRQFTSTQGRWLTPDPYMGSMDLTNPQSLNRYVYVINNPTNASDPLGLVCTGDEGGGNCGSPNGHGGGGVFGLGITPWDFVEPLKRNCSSNWRMERKLHQ